MKIKNLLLILFIFICSSMAWAAPINPQEAKYITNQWFSTYAPGKFLYSDIKTLTPLQSGEQTVLYITREDNKQKF